ncbi:PP2C family protein-serine/threonine phosphatase [Pseudoduganella violaceinigra]|uniref:PP2C family protein-serine/threonine phosphatase n=1 Tax=Pseudoduganella violaceinigra TaxID=246602 RepID=UPI0004130255|nr:protein phosphatase 2C domain-containing protein [Pseudoduganella violaceinigra]
MIPLSPPVLQQMPMGLAYGLTDVGTVRPSNQDNLLLLPELNFLAVADGMGGHVGGDIASTEALTLVWKHLRALPPAASEAEALSQLQDAVLFANATLFRNNAAAGLADGYGMGTTLTGMWQPQGGGPALLFHVGDSRIYRYRNGQLAQLTHDQTLYQQALEAGMTGVLPPRNLLLQAIGPAQDVRPDVFAHPLAPGDIYLLCSDGLYGASDDATLAAILAGAGPDNLPESCVELVEKAKQDGSRDNITAVLLLCPAA